MQNKMVIIGSVFLVLITGIQTEIPGTTTKGFVKNNGVMSSSETSLSSPVTDDGKLDNTQITTQAIQNMTESYNVVNTSLTNSSVSYNATNNEEDNIFMNDSNVKNTKSRDVNMTMFNTADSYLTEANMTRANATEDQTFKNQTVREVSLEGKPMVSHSRSGEEEKGDKDEEDEDEDEDEEEDEQQEEERREEGTDDYRVERDYDDAGFSDNYNYNYMQQRGEMEMEHLNHQAKLFNELGLRQNFEDWSISLDERMEDMVRVLGEDENLPYKELKIPHSAYKSSENKSEPKFGTGYNDFSFIENFSEDYYDYPHKDF